MYCQLSDPEEEEFDYVAYSPGLDNEREDNTSACESIQSNTGVCEVLFSPDDETICNSGYLL